MAAAAMPEPQDFQFPPRTTAGDDTTAQHHEHHLQQPQQPQQQQLSSRPASSDTMTPTADHDPANPFSAFYAHPSARRSAETPRQQQLLHPADAGQKHPYITVSDVESGLGGAPVSAATTQTNLSGMPKVSVERSKECAMWPSKQTLLEQRDAEKRKRRGRCDCMAGLTKRQKLAVQVLLALLVVGAAVGVGVGISRAVGGGVWAGTGQTKQVPQDGDH